MKRMYKLLIALSLALTASCSVDENGAEAFIEATYPDYTGYSCMSWDSDGDGYVSCTVTFAPPKDPIPVECARKLTPILDGCRIATGRARFAR